MFIYNHVKSQKIESMKYPISNNHVIVLVKPPSNPHRFSFALKDVKLLVLSSERKL
jgi:hypothetical protein